MRHIISLLMENEAGALSRVSGLFSARGYNIESLSVAPTEDLSLSRMTIVTSGSDEVVEQIIKQLNKLIDVVKVLDLHDGDHIERELVLVKVKANKQYRDEVQQLSNSYGGRIIDSSENILTIEFTGTSTELDNYLKSLNSSFVVEIVRTGASGIGRGDRILKI
ncbi:acetolactate synthase small subunit [Methylophilaceae bacterium]|nr:acetolactate synthase small subunit [Methylophilaceae bacterium]